MDVDFDLLGDPIPENWGKAGRPAHIPTLRNRNRVILLLAMGWDDGKIAGALSITRPTLKKHYFRELRFRDEARPRAEAQALEAVYQKAVEGSVAALKEWRRLLDRADLAEQAEIYQPQQRKPAAPRLGKKAERHAAAQEIGGIYAPGAPPPLITH